MMPFIIVATNNSIIFLLTTKCLHMNFNWNLEHVDEFERSVNSIQDHMFAFSERKREVLSVIKNINYSPFIASRAFVLTTLVSIPVTTTDHRHYLLIHRTTGPVLLLPFPLLFKSSKYQSATF